MDRTRRKAIVTFSKAAIVGGALYALSAIPRVFPVDVSQLVNGYVVGYQSKAPTIDGIWSDGEWDDANELTISNVAARVNDKIGASYFRAKHDNDKFNFIVASPSDDGIEIPNSQTTLQFELDCNDDGLYDKDPNDAVLFTRIQNGQVR